MSHEWDTGFTVRKPSWHQMERAVLKESPRTWEAARTEAELLWEVETDEVYRRFVGYEHHVCKPWCEEGCEITEDFPVQHEVIKGWQSLNRSDTGALLSIQPKTYEVVHNAKFGEVIDAALGVTAEDDPVTFEALFSLSGGKQIVALTYFDEPLQISWDPSTNYCFVSFITRHDGQGGLRGIPTNVRTICRNTINLAEATDGKRVGFTIRHTANWEERLEEIALDMAAAREESKKWVEFSEQLALWKAGPRQREAYLKKFLPQSDDMGDRAKENVLVSRDRIRQILTSEKCEGIAGTGYGLLMATTEWADHSRMYHSTDSYVTRQLLAKQAPKAKAASVLRTMARI